MDKKTFIVNGLPRSGKDTFAENLGKLCKAKKISVIEPVVTMLALCPLADVSKKSPEDRVLYNEIKKALDKHSHITTRYAAQEYGKFLVSSYDILLIDIRNPVQIDEVKGIIPCRTVLIERDGMASCGSEDDDPEMIEGYTYDYRINNNGTLEEFLEKTKSFYERIIKE